MVSDKTANVQGASDAARQDEDAPEPGEEPAATAAAAKAATAAAGVLISASFIGPTLLTHGCTIRPLF